MPRATYTIPNMICPACNVHIEELEDELPGILFVRANYKKQRMDIEWDETQIDEKTIRTAVAELGYEIVD